MNIKCLFFLLISLQISVFSMDNEIKDFLSNLEKNKTIEQLEKAENLDKVLDNYEQYILKYELKKIILEKFQNFKVNRGLESVLLGANVCLHDAEKEIAKFAKLYHTYFVDHENGDIGAPFLKQQIGEKYTLHVNQDHVYFTKQDHLYIIANDSKQKYIVDYFNETLEQRKATLIPDTNYIACARTYELINEKQSSELKDKYKTRFYENDPEGTPLHNKQYFTLISIIDISNPLLPKKSEEFCITRFFCSELIIDSNMNLFTLFMITDYKNQLKKFALGNSSILMDLTITQLTFLIELKNNQNNFNIPNFKTIYDSFNPKFKEYLRTYFCKEILKSKFYEDISDIVIKYLFE